jgi:hypothetical protein
MPPNFTYCFTDAADLRFGQLEANPPTYTFGGSGYADWSIPQWQCTPANNCQESGFRIFAYQSTNWGTYVLPLVEESDNFGTLSAPFNLTIKVAECIQFGPEIKSAADSYHIDELTLAAVAAQESGTSAGDNGVANLIGDNGHGYGLFQIDDRWHSSFTGSGL